MKIAIIADSHVDSGSRFAECVRLHNWMRDDISDRGPDLILHAGDIFEGKSDLEERPVVADMLQGLADIAPVVAVRGNHDLYCELPLFSRLHTRHPIRIEERARVHVVAGVAVACLAWPHKAMLLANAGRVSPEQSSVLASEALRNVLRGMGHELAQHDGPRVLLAHAMVRGSKTSTERVLVGVDMELGLDDLGLAGADLCALGHIHCHQSWEWDGKPIIYPGSPRRHDFGETEAKGYVFAEIDANHGCRWEFVAIPATRMVLLEAEWSDGDLHGLEAVGVMNAEVRVRYSVPSDQREAAKAAEARWTKKLLDRLAVSVKMEPVVVATTRARAPEIATARTTWDKLEVHWHSRGIEIGERRPALQEKLAELESEAGK